MLRPIRAAISLAILLGALWAAFAIELGDKTFAEHIDSISQTPEAKQLIEDTREAINPALVEVRDRVLGEYVEAPTWIPEQDVSPAKQPSAAKRETRARAGEGSEPLLPGRRPEAVLSNGLEPPLPGQRHQPESFEPPLPGRR